MPVAYELRAAVLVRLLQPLLTVAVRTLRRDWSELPAAVRDEVGRRLGSPVRDFEERDGGFSSGVLGVATPARGEQVFVKAVPGASADAGDYRTEMAVAAALPPAVPAPRLRFAFERAGWLLLCFDVARGAPAHEPWRPGELAAALRALAVCAVELTPSPVGGLPTVAARLAGRCETWQALERDGVRGEVTVEGVGAWERGHLARLAAVEATWGELVAGETLLHFDLRFDNVVIGPSGAASLLDWGRACTGPAWADLVCLLLLSDLGGLDPEDVFAGHPAGAGAEPERVEAFLVALAGYWTRAASLPGPAHAPHLRGRRERSRRATIAWLRRRWGERW
ncbi:Predicted kinase, aminoglycoside phosphotransferase (APT) family [Nonomuraea pusilla]|uniref:Predicted kinase, aminoglycoside phosphotransferase (APT) family n=1 Tax=Nonomuraea pusilla TaxID=46177 RepID=A0A1H8HJA8_9ACTN|nr:Predicted kinase, aminoglycoside phosphotransferase (APT) family [Nonomuraea pusilla]